jgi:hypothetical protein
MHNLECSVCKIDFKQEDWVSKEKPPLCDHCDAKYGEDYRKCSVCNHEWYDTFDSEPDCTNCLKLGNRA